MPNGCTGTLRFVSMMPTYTLSLGDTAEISMLLCFNADNQIDTAVEITLDLPESMPEIALAGGDFSESGEGNVQITGTSDCIPLTIFISADSTATPGDFISIPVTVAAPAGLCDQSDSLHSTIHLFIVDPAASTCTCAHEEGNVDLKGNIWLSEAIAKGAFGNPNDPVYSPPCLSVNGVLRVDIPSFSLNNCELLMGPAAQIIVEPNSSLYLRNNHIHGCDYMWSSITKELAGTMLAQNNLIEDGLYALQYTSYLNPLADIPVAHISYNVFSKNLIGVVNSSYTHAKINFENFSANEFTCEGETLLPSPKPSLSYPPAASKTWAGVFLLALSNTANLSSIAPLGKNHFHHIQNGIIADGTSAIVRNARFDHIPVNSDYENTPIGIGVGIHGTGGLIQEGEGMNSDIPSFDSVTVGIFARAGVLISGMISTISIQKNYMRAVKTGIKIDKGMSFAMKILDNSIICDDAGIDVFKLADYQSVSIKGNDIYVDSLQGNLDFGRLRRPLREEVH